MKKSSGKWRAKPQAVYDAVPRNLEEWFAELEKVEQERHRVLQEFERR